MLSRTVASGRLVLLAALVCSAVPASTSASMLQVQFTGMDLQYDGSTIFDGGLANTTHAGNPAQADPLAAVYFYLNGSPAGPTLTTDIFADIRIPGVTNIPVGGGFVMGNPSLLPAFGFDLLTKNMVPGWGLALDIDSPVQISYSPGSQTIICSVMTNTVSYQDLPYGLALGTPITISFSCHVTEVTDNGQYLTSFRASGAGEVTGPLAPPIPVDPVTWSRIKQQFVK